MSIGPSMIAMFVAGTGLGASLMYFIGNYKLKETEAKQRVDEVFFKNLAIEQRMWLSSEGRILKDEYLNVEERLLYKQFPLTQWAPHKRLLNQSIDADTMVKMAKELSHLAAAGQLPIRATIREISGT